jgi:outer membrane protein assembly factor BamB
MWHQFTTLTLNAGSLIVLNSNGMTHWLFYQPPEDYMGIVAEDFDRDGTFEVVAASFNGKLYIVQGVSIGRPPLPLPVSILEPAWDSVLHTREVTVMVSGDFDGDGIDDIASSNTQGHIYGVSGNDGDKLWEYPLESHILSLFGKSRQRISIVTDLMKL